MGQPSPGRQRQRTPGSSRAARSSRAAPARRCRGRRRGGRRTCKPASGGDTERVTPSPAARGAPAPPRPHSPALWGRRQGRAGMARAGRCTRSMSRRDSPKPPGDVESGGEVGVGQMHPPRAPCIPSRTPCRRPALTIPLKKVNAAVRSRTRTSPTSWGRWYRGLRCSSATWERKRPYFQLRTLWSSPGRAIKLAAPSAAPRTAPAPAPAPRSPSQD